MTPDDSMMLTTEAEAAVASGNGGRRLLSGDGAWWWNGRRWVPAITEDGLWRWDGSRWRATVDLEGKRPEDLATTLALLAEDRYAEAGSILSERPEEWQPEGPSRELVEHARQLKGRLERVEEGLAPADGARGLRRRLVSTEDRRQLEEERDSVAAELRALLVRLGRIAPQPSIKEADDLLGAARLLDERAAMMTAGLAEVDEAERMRADAAAAAQRELAAAEESRLRALQEARRAVEAAESAHAWAVAEARARLRTVLTPGPGELKAGLGPLRLFANVLETPTGRLPAASTAAYVDTAPALWAEHRDALADLILLEAPESETFLDALTEGSSALFLLVVGPTGTALWPCPPGQEKAAQRFATVVTEHARDARRVKDDRDAKAKRAEQELEAITRDRSPIEAAEAELARVEADPGLLGAIDEARERLNRARADTPELIEARRKVMELARRLVAPPEPLRAAN
ncbi:MAG TPA: hypothetical protein VFD01_16800 [Candidatus Dormibacteraeota bacterium]|jgi:hypothetical protein|nr:hypothetical protein [Candidatus Dormibacteraeota bacterium]